MNFKDFYLLEDENDLLVKQANEFKTSEDFLKSQYTGYIASNVYKDMDFDKKIEDCPKIIKTMKLKTGEEIQFRQTGTKLQYVKKNGNDIVRDQKGLAKMLSHQEMIDEGLPLEDTTVHVFNSKGQEIGYASDEFGADGIWVKPEYQRQGIGVELLYLFKQQFKDPSRKIGQMTSAGMNMTRAYWRKLTGGKKPNIQEVLNKFKMFLKTFDISKYRNDYESYIKDAWIAAEKFQDIMTNDEKVEFGKYFHPDDFNPQESLEDFYDRNK